ncbi:hypothetical protein YC2023_102380 [Brassica napus]
MHQLSRSLNFQLLGGIMKTMLVPQDFFLVIETSEKKPRLNIVFFLRLKIFFFLRRIKRRDQFLYARRRTSLPFSLSRSTSVLPPSLPFKIYYSHPILFASFALICSSPANYPLWFIGKLLYLPISR